MTTTEVDDELRDAPEPDDVPPTGRQIWARRLRRALRWRPSSELLFWTRIVAVSIWIEVFVAFYLRDGFPFDREGLMLWISTLLIASSIGRRSVFSVIVDWIPFAAVLLVYDYMRGASENFEGRTLWTPQIAVDKFLFFGHEPTVWLQQHLKDVQPHWWDVIASATYTSFFLLPYVVAGILWFRSRREFHRWAGRFVVMSFCGLTGFILFPAAPPWAASQCTATEVASHPSHPSCLGADPAKVPNSLLGRFVPDYHGAGGYVQRISGRGFEELHLTVAKSLLDKGQGVVDLVAAVPSLHGGITLLFVLFMWKRSRWYWRVVMAIYALTMAFALVYSAEHYFFDILVGWALAIIVHNSFGWLERRRSRARAADTLEVRTDAPMETPCPPTVTASPPGTTLSSA